MTQVYTVQRTWKNRRGLRASSTSINCSTSASEGRTTSPCGLLKVRANVPLRTSCSKYWGNKWIGCHSVLLDSIPNGCIPITPLFAVFTHCCTFYMTTSVHITWLYILHDCTCYMTSKSTADGGYWVSWMPGTKTGLSEKNPWHGKKIQSWIQTLS